MEVGGAGRFICAVSTEKQVIFQNSQHRVTRNFLLGFPDGWRERKRGSKALVSAFANTGQGQGALRVRTFRQWRFFQWIRP